jgi:hypothetical protein
MNLLLHRSNFVDFYTYLDPIFEAAPELADFTFLISEIELGCQRDERLASEPSIISGHELRAIVESRKVQFIWAVLSAFDDKPAVPTELPFADGNSRFWEGSPKPQISDAKFEIVCWDSSATLFIGIEAATATKLRHRYPDILDLDDYNRRNA